ncbi:hypothetical protein C8Q80DRAFT_1124075 [Daedaleopsis nitida]|nr:hypothetical protein C8Q80DRAFT_1124075 [Daedaleopsis nitida]
MRRATLLPGNVTEYTTLAKLCLLLLVLLLRYHRRRKRRLGSGGAPNEVLEASTTSWARRRRVHGPRTSHPGRRACDVLDNAVAHRPGLILKKEAEVGVGRAPNEASTTSWASRRRIYGPRTSHPGRRACKHAGKRGCASSRPDLEEGGGGRGREGRLMRRRIYGPWTSHPGRRACDVLDNAVAHRPGLILKKEAEVGVGRAPNEASTTSWASRRRIYGPRTSHPGRRACKHAGKRGCASSRPDLEEGGGGRGREGRLMRRRIYGPWTSHPGRRACDVLDNAVAHRPGLILKKEAEVGVGRAPNEASTTSWASRRRIYGPRTSHPGRRACKHAGKRGCASSRPDLEEGGGGRGREGRLMRRRIYGPWTSHPGRRACDVLDNAVAHRPGLILKKEAEVGVGRAPNEASTTSWASRRRIYGPRTSHPGRRACKHAGKRGCASSRPDLEEGGGGRGREGRLMRRRIYGPWTSHPGRRACDVLDNAVAHRPGLILKKEAEVGVGRAPNEASTTSWASRRRIYGPRTSHPGRRACKHAGKRGCASSRPDLEEGGGGRGREGRLMRCWRRARRPGPADVVSTGPGHPTGLLGLENGEECAVVYRPGPSLTRPCANSGLSEEVNSPEPAGGERGGGVDERKRGGLSMSNGLKDSTSRLVTRRGARGGGVGLDAQCSIPSPLAHSSPASSYLAPDTFAPSPSLRSCPLPARCIRRRALTRRACDVQTRCTSCGPGYMDNKGAVWAACETVVMLMVACNPGTAYRPRPGYKTTTTSSATPLLPALRIHTAVVGIERDVYRSIFQPSPLATGRGRGNHHLVVSCASGRTSAVTWCSYMLCGSPATVLSLSQPAFSSPDRISTDTRAPPPRLRELHQDAVVADPERAPDQQVTRRTRQRTCSRTPASSRIPCPAFTRSGTGMSILYHVVTVLMIIISGRAETAKHAISRLSRPIFVGHTVTWTL